jgi:DNA polymerase
MYKKPYEVMWAAYQAGQEEERQNSKPAVLGAGYGLGGGKMITNENGDKVRGGLWGYAKNVCGVDMPLDLAHESVRIFRETYTEVVQLWTDLEEAFKQVLMRGGSITVGEVHWNRKQHEWQPHTHGLGCHITFTRRKMEGGGYLIRMQLPSGRALHYLNATVEQETKISEKDQHEYTVDVLRYDGIEHSTTQDANGQNVKKKRKWGRVKTYGGKLCENAVQAIARDILLNGMTMADDMGFHIFGLFHDELACEEEDSWTGLKLCDLTWCMSQVPDWAPGLLLGAEGFEGAYYKKG